MSFGIFVIALCCIYFMVMGYIPEPLRFITRISLLSLLCLDLGICTVNRLTSLFRGITASKLGVLLFHLGVAVTITAGLLGGQGHSASILLKENQSADLNDLGFPIAFKVAAVRAEYYPSGEIKQYFTNIVLLEEDKEIAAKDISVNHPAEYNGIKIYQSKFEASPDGYVTGLTVKTEPGLPLVWTGFAVLGVGIFLMLFRRN
jgi:cytochrome c biogenesis protein ResB